MTWNEFKLTMILMGFNEQKTSTFLILNVFTHLTLNVRVSLNVNDMESPRVICAYFRINADYCEGRSLKDTLKYIQTFMDTEL